MPVTKPSDPSRIEDFAALAEIIARTATTAGIHAGDGKPSVRFLVVSHPVGYGFETAAKALAQAMTVQVVDMRTVSLAKGDLDEGAPSHDYFRKTLENMGAAFILCSETGAAAPGVLREVVTFLAAQDVDRDDVRQTRVVMLATQGPAADAVEVVRLATGKNPVGFLVIQ